MQFMIDTDRNSTEELHLASLMLASIVAARKGEVVQPPAGIPLAPTVAAPPVPLPPPPPPPPPSALAAAIPAGAGAPTGAAVPPSAVPAVAEFDKAGMQWDARIHQAGKSQKKDGTWKLKKNIDPAIVVEVTQELAKLRAASASVAALVHGEPKGPTITPEIAARIAAASASNGATPPAPVPPPPPPPAPPVTGAPAVTASTAEPMLSPFRAVCRKIIEAEKVGKLPKDVLNSILQKHGVPGLQMLNTMAHLIPEVEGDIDLAIFSAA